MIRYNITTLSTYLPFSLYPFFHRCTWYLHGSCRLCVEVKREKSRLVSDRKCCRNLISTISFPRSYMSFLSSWEVSISWDTFQCLVRLRKEKCIYKWTSLRTQKCEEELPGRIKYIACQIGCVVHSVANRLLNDLTTYYMYISKKSILVLQMYLPL